MTHYMTLSYDLKYLHVENSIPKFSEISIENLYIDVIFSKFHFKMLCIDVSQWYFLDSLTP